MTTINTSLDGICAQRKKQMLFTVAPPRNNILESSPYLQGYTQAQLNMRRKAEILKYAGNKQNTKTNTLTKKQLYSQIIRSRNQVDLTTVTNNVVCPTDEIIYTPTSSSGVPGPVTYLYLDESVPLYNYTPNVNANGITDTAIVNEYNTIVVDNNTFFNDDELTKLFMLNITEVVVYPQNTYNIAVPIGFNVFGKKKIILIMCMIILIYQSH